MKADFGPEGALCMTCQADLEEVGEYEVIAGEVVCPDCAVLFGWTT